jgi:hypothetical protein
MPKNAVLCIVVAIVAFGLAVTSAFADCGANAYRSGVTQKGNLIIDICKCRPGYEPIVPYYTIVLGDKWPGCRKRKSPPQKKRLRPPSEAPSVNSCANQGMRYDVNTRKCVPGPPNACGLCRDEECCGAGGKLCKSSCPSGQFVCIYGVAVCP